MKIAYEDEIFLIIDKPPGLPTQNTQNPKKENLYSMALEFLEQREGRETYLALHHRLDAATAGLVLFCKNKRYNKYVTDLFRDRKIEKSYLALVEVLKPESLKEEFEVHNKLKTYKMRHFKKAKSATKGDEAITFFKLIENRGSTALLECFPKTGRLHQIRVHLSELGLPVVGDFHYHPKKQSGNLKLLANQLSFVHPKSHKHLVITSSQNL